MNSKESQRRVRDSFRCVTPRHNHINRGSAKNRRLWMAYVAGSGWTRSEMKRKTKTGWIQVDMQTGNCLRIVLCIPCDVQKAS